MKIHIWHKAPSFPDRVNFVDSNNVFVGYEMYQQCCESATWCISTNIDGSEPVLSAPDDPEESKEFEVEDYCFDPDFFYQTEDNERWDYYSAFKLISHGKPDFFLILSNSHNGYYSHGFTFRGNKTIEGSL